MIRLKTSFLLSAPAYWLYLVVSLMLVQVVEPRYLRPEETVNDLSASSRNVLGDVEEEDVDLEMVVEDYYDDLWQYLYRRSYGLDGDEKLKRKPAGKAGGSRPTFPDYDYMSDMPAGEPPADDRQYKALQTDHQKEGKDNLTKVAGSDGGNDGPDGEDQMSSVLRANRESNSEEEFAQRSKEMRLKSIISQVLSFRGGSPKSNETIPDSRHFNALREIYEKNMKRIKTEDWTASYTEKVQSFYPSCDVPRNTDEDVWTDQYSMNLLFDLDYPDAPEDSTIMIVSAKLRLFKMAQENSSGPVPEGSLKGVKSEKVQGGGGLGVLPSDDDRQIRVSVYWYTRSLRRHRAKKKLLDSQMLSMTSPKWAEFNIRAAVRTWKDSGKNFGLVVTVEDEDGVLLPADQYIHSMNCSKWTATARPIPSIIMDKAHQYYVESVLGSDRNDTVVVDDTKSEDGGKRQLYPYEPPPYPIIDLRLREVPNSEAKNLALVNSAKIALESRLLNLTRRGLGLAANGTNPAAPFTIILKNFDGPKFPDPKPASLVRKTGTDGRVSYFQNVPIGSPSASSSRTGFTRRSHPDGTDMDAAATATTPGKRYEPGLTSSLSDHEGGSHRLRHSGRKHGDSHHRSSSRSDFAASDSGGGGH